MASSFRLVLHHLLAVAFLSLLLHRLQNACANSLGLKGSSSMFCCANAISFTSDLRSPPLAPELLVHLGSNVPPERFVPSLEPLCSPQLSRCARASIDQLVALRRAGHRALSRHTTRVVGADHVAVDLLVVVRVRLVVGLLEHIHLHAHPTPETCQASPWPSRASTRSSRSGTIHLHSVSSSLHRDLDLAALLLGMNSSFTSWV
mmetsp:Transcript_19701/g.51600  ORF Transcript_19701/g.51600 Transcript_19701/m.51600 type:complete len:204 (+) Transcript_19701:201-812(+)